jgi:Tfp pilus assembly protein PilO
VIRVIKVREYNDYNINEWGSIFKITLCIMVILCVEMKLQMIENFNKLTEEV